MGVSKVKTTYFIEPVDVLHFRGNRLFGDPGSFSDAVMPPWPSTFAGAIRSEILTSDGVNLDEFAAGHLTHPLLGTPNEPGEFRVLASGLARRLSDDSIERYYPLPADLVITDSAAGPVIRKIEPKPMDERIHLSSKTKHLPVLTEAHRSKPLGGWFLRESGWQQYLRGVVPCANTEIIHQEQLWGVDLRVGVGLDAVQRRAADGQLFTNQAICLRPEIGFYVTINHDALPDSGALRLGGDGRAANYTKVAPTDQAMDLDTITHASRCRLVLTTPGIFASGWLPNGASTQEDTPEGTLIELNLQGLQASIVAACVAKPQVISGWDMPNKRPKAAMKSVPAGSVFWLENIQASAESIGKLAEIGLWSSSCEDTQRRAEGFNHVAIGAY